MVVLAVTVLFTVATIVGLAVVISSLTRAWRTYGDLKIALFTCDNCSPTFVQWHGTGGLSTLPRLRKSSVNPAKRARLLPRVLHAAA